MRSAMLLALACGGLGFQMPPLASRPASQPSLRAAPVSMGLGRPAVSLLAAAGKVATKTAAKPAVNAGLLTVIETNPIACIAGAAVTYYLGKDAFKDWQDKQDNKKAEKVRKEKAQERDDAFTSFIEFGAALATVAVTSVATVLEEPTKSKDSDAGAADTDDAQADAAEDEPAEAEAAGDEEVEYETVTVFVDEEGNEVDAPKEDPSPSAQWDKIFGINQK